MYQLLSDAYEAYSEDEEDPKYKDYRRYVYQQAQRQELCNKINKREADMREAHPSVHVFSAAAGPYMTWLRGGLNDDEKPLLMVPQTGIHDIRKFLLNIPADGNLSAHREHLSYRMEEIVKEMLHVEAKYKSDSRYDGLVQDLKTRIPALEGQLQGTFNTCVSKMKTGMWDENKKRKATTGIERFMEKLASSIAWNTYKKTVREYGIPIRSKAKGLVGQSKKGMNWNNDISRILREPVEAWYKVEYARAGAYCNAIDQQTRDVRDYIRKAIEDHPGHKGLKDAAIRDLINWERDVTALTTLLRERSLQSVKEAYLLATTETDIGCIIAKILKPAYEEAAVSPGGKGSYAKRRMIVENALLKPYFKGKRFLQHFEAIVLEHMITDLTTLFDEFRKNVMDESNDFVATLKDRLLTAHNPTENDLHAHDCVEQMRPDFQKELMEIREMHPDDKVKNGNTEERSAKKAKLC